MAEKAKSSQASGRKQYNTRKTTKTQSAKSTNKIKNTKARNNRNKIENNANSKKTYVLTEHDLIIKKEVKLLILIAASVILLLSNFNLCGAIGSFLSSIMFGCFGLYAYIIPVFIFIAGVVLVSNSFNYKAITKITTFLILIIFLCSMAQLIYGVDNIKVLDFYKLCSINHNGGGIVGGLIASLLIKAIGNVGTYIILIALIIVCIVIITEKSVITPIKNSSKKAYKKAREEASSIKEKNYKVKKHIQAKNLKNDLDNEVNNSNVEHIDDNDNIDNNSFIDNAKINNTDMPLLHEIDHVQKEEKPITSILNENIFKKYNANETIIKEEQNIEKTEVQEDEEGFFKPKEQIYVSKEAKETMSRKPFSKVPNQEVRIHTDGDSKDIVEAPIPEIIETENKEKLIYNNLKQEYTLPPLDILTVAKHHGTSKQEQIELRDTALKLQQTLQNFGVKVTITDVSRGPSVTRYELQPEQGTKVSKITSLSDDIKLNLAAADIRIEAPIPGKAAVGIEVPNKGRDTVYFRELIESDELKKHPSKLAFAAGKDIAGKVIVADIGKMPHMLIAGTTGSGKSVFTNSIIMSILYRAKPDEVKLIIVDPKVVEFGVYNGIPHLLIPVVTEPRKAAAALNWAVAEMGERYKKFAEYNVRDIKGYNKRAEESVSDTKLEKLPQIVIIIDELADLMMAAAKEVEDAICRLAQLARAAGIHLVIATQRPSVDVVTGLIKANIPSRVALLVSSGTDSRTILDSNGAEKLLGNGDMLFYPSGYVKPVRLQGAFISDGEVSAVVNFIKQNSENVNYNVHIQDAVDTPANTENESNNENDAYFMDAARFVVDKQKASTSMLQRVFKIGFNRAARIMDQLCEFGVIGSEEGTKPRKVLLTSEELEELILKK